MSYAALQAERGAWLRRPAAELPIPYAGREWRLEWLPQLEPLLRDRPVRKRFGQHGTWLGRVVGSFDAFFQVQSKYCLVRYHLLSIATCFGAFFQVPCCWV